MISSVKTFGRSCRLRRGSNLIGGIGILIWFGAASPVCALASPAQSAQPASVAGAQTASPAPPQATAAAAGQESHQLAAASISGTVIGPDGSPVIEALVTLVRNGQTVQQVRATDNGQFSFPGIAPGIYQITLAAEGFETQTVSADVHPGETYTAPRITLALAPLVTTIKVTPPQAEVAQYQLQHEERQLVLGFIPNYMVSYYPHTAPLTARQKFQLTFKTVFNPFTLGLTTAFVGDALLPSILHQDPRFYYKGNGSVPSRLFYAISRSVICKGDNGHWEPDVSAVMGHFAAGAAANLYLPQQNRKAWGTTLENGLIGIGFDAIANILQEFVLPRFTPALSHRQFGKP